MNEDLKGAKVLLTRAGTWISWEPQYDDADCGYWKWTNSAENAFYTGFEEDGRIYWDDEVGDEIVIIDLKSSSFKYGSFGIIVEMKIAK